MTVLPGDSSGDATPVPFKRKRLCLSLNSERRRIHEEAKVQVKTEPSPPSPSSSMDSMSNFTAFTPGSKLSIFGSRAEGTEQKFSNSDFGSSSSSSVLSPSRKAVKTSSPIATLSNMGNTCYLNSVLYTLRFTPNFMHNMHHVMKELGQQTVSDPDSAGRQEKVHAAYARLHDLFATLKINEDVKGKSHQPFAPSLFLTSFRDLYPTFESHQQHDAHELFVCLFDIIRDASAKLNAKPADEKKTPATPSPKPQLKLSITKSKKKKEKLKQEVKEELIVTPEGVKQKLDLDFVKQLEGTTLLRTICLECESFTERKEKFLDICVPIVGYEGGEAKDDAETKENPSQLYRSLLLSSENINGQNKYWCEVCKHHNEVRRCTSYETLPNLLALQLKRFSTNSSSIFSMSKIHDYMPTPLSLECFCDACPKESPNEEHTYQLYAVIMHLGSTMASGHYVAYVRAESKQNYSECQVPVIATAPPAAPTGGGGIRKFLRKPEKVSSAAANGSCPAADCCGIKINLPEEITPHVQWLECDDDHVRVLSEVEFCELLQPAKSATFSPYILFYTRKNPSN